jgi:hypothetical protein
MKGGNRGFKRGGYRESNNRSNNPRNFGRGRENQNHQYQERTNAEPFHKRLTSALDNKTRTYIIDLKAAFEEVNFKEEEGKLLLSNVLEELYDKLFDTAIEIETAQVLETIILNCSAVQFSEICKRYSLQYVTYITSPFVDNFNRNLPELSCHGSGSRIVEIILSLIPKHYSTLVSNADSSLSSSLESFVSTLCEVFYVHEYIYI